MLKKTTMALATLTIGAVAMSPVTNAATVLLLEPLSVGQGKVMKTVLRGALCTTTNNLCQEIDYPASLAPSAIPEGVVALYETLDSTAGKVIVFGYSEGAQVAEIFLAEHADDADAPAAADLSFLLIGNPYRGYGGLFTPFGRLAGYVPSQTKYEVTDLARQYDGFADVPDKFFSPGYALAVANAVVGMFIVHNDYEDVDLNATDNISWKVDNITYVLAPTNTLPLLAPLEAMGLNDLADTLNTVLQPMIEAAYSRPSPQSPSAQASPAITDSPTTWASVLAAIPTSPKTETTDVVQGRLRRAETQANELITTLMAQAKPAKPETVDAVTTPAPTPIDNKTVEAEVVSAGEGVTGGTVFGRTKTDDSRKPWGAARYSDSNDHDALPGGTDRDTTPAPRIVRTAGVRASLRASAQRFDSLLKKNNAPDNDAHTKSASDIRPGTKHRSDTAGAAAGAQSNTGKAAPKKAAD